MNVLQNECHEILVNLWRVLNYELALGYLAIISGSFLLILILKECFRLKKEIKND